MNQKYTRYEGVSAQDIPMYALGTMPYGALAQVIAENGLAMDSADLEHCRRYFFAVLRRAPSLNELKMLDGIIKIRRARLSSYRITRIASEDKWINETYNDLCAKAKYLRKNASLPLSLDELASVAPEYLRSIGCDAITEAGRENAQKTINAPLQPEISLLLLLPNSEADHSEYAERVRALYSDVRLYGRLGPVKTVNEFGLLSTLSEFSNGIFGDASQLPVCEGEGDISILSGKYRGRMIVCAFGYLADTVKALASELGLCAYHFAKTTNTGKLFFRRSASPEIYLDIRFIKELTEANTYAVADIPATSSEPNISNIGQPTDMMIADGTDIITLSAGLSHDPFNTSVKLPLYLLLSAMARGYTRRDIGIKTEYLFSHKADRDSLALSVSSILGVYRAFIETCVSSDASVKYASGEPAVTCTAFCKGRKGRKDISQKFTAEGSRLYLLRVAYLPDGLPDFAALRTACKQIEELVKSKKILSARAVCGDIRSAVEAMSGDLGVGSELMPDKTVFGVIIESTHTLPMQQIGVTVRI